MKRRGQALLAAALLASATMVVVALIESGTVSATRTAGPWAHAALALAAASIAVTAASAWAPRLKRPALVRGLGHAAFFAGLAGAAAGFRDAMVTTARIGPSFTPADMADSIDAALACAIAGAVAEAVALGCAGVLRLRPSPAPPPPLDQ